MSKIIITDAGRKELINAEQTGAAPIKLVSVGLGDGRYTATSSDTALRSEIKRLSTLKGGAISPTQIHVTAHDNTFDIYSVYEVGLFLESGTLFAIYANGSKITEKASNSEVLFAFDIEFTDIDVSSISFGDTNFNLNQATTDKIGVVEIATSNEAKTATDELKVITPKTLNDVIEVHNNIVHKKGSETITGTKTFSVSPLLPTPAESDNSKKATTTEWVVNSISKETEARKSAIDNEIKERQNAVAKCLPLSGGAMTSTLSIARDVSTSYLGLFGGKERGGGAQLDLFGLAHPSMPSSFQLHASNKTTDIRLIGSIDGTLTWNGNSVLTEANYPIPDYSSAIALSSVETKYTPSVNGYFKVQPGANMGAALRIDVAVGDESFNIFLSGSYGKYDMTKTFWIPIVKLYTYKISHPHMVTFVPTKID